MSKKIIGLDLGTKTLGIAITSSDQKFVLGMETVRFNSNDYVTAAKRIEQILQEENVESIIVGYPLNMDDRKGPRVEAVEKFKLLLGAFFPLTQIKFVDERLSTIEAYERLSALGYNKAKQKELVDMWAAKVILETYLAQREEKNDGTKS
ncbi:MAG TPA: Holliday junction resolvase RuvX [Bacilli bacterium]|nr:Holliday junction resolvase RuvX [Bacilli bacterium]